jgi:hypothetical protein
VCARAFASAETARTRIHEHKHTSTLTHTHTEVGVRKGNKDIFKDNDLEFGEMTYLTIERSLCLAPPYAVCLTMLAPPFTVLYLFEGKRTRSKKALRYSP